MRFLFCCNTLHGFCNFRLDVVKHLVGKDNEAVIVFPYHLGDEETLKTLPLGCRAIECRMSPKGKSLIQDARYLLQLLKIIKQESPEIVFNYTVKPNVYGGIAARIRGVPSIAMAPGLGFVFAQKGIIGALLRKFYVIGLKLSQRVFVLNSSDRDCLVEAGVNRDRIVLLSGGEGVNLERFPFSEGTYRQPRFLMISRLLYEKGYREFVQAAKKVKVLYPYVRFEIVGRTSKRSPAGVPLGEIQSDEKSGSIRYLGFVEDIYTELSDPDTVVVLPSYYREGMNRSLMEACSCGRPVITTNLPGLREMVEDGGNGYLAEPMNVDSLFEKIVSFMALPVERRIQMGRRSREIAETRFDVEDVKAQYDAIIESLLLNNV